MGYAKVYIWSGIDRLGVAGISFVSNIILARLLSTDDFGLVGMVAIFFSIAYSFADCGLCDGLIKMDSPHKKDYATVFVFNLIVGILIAILFYIIAIPISVFFEKKSLIIIIRLIGIALLLNSLTFSEETKLRRELKMKELAIVKLSSSVIASSISILMAFNGWGFLALVYLQIMVPGFILLGFIILLRWRPVFLFDMKAFTILWGFGRHLLVSFFINQAGRNLNSFVLGKISSVHIVGLYSQAQKLQEVPMTIFDSIFCNTSYPVLSSFTQKKDKVRFIQKLSLRIIFFYSLLVVTLYTIAPFVIQFLYGEKWALAIPIFRILLFVGLLQSIRYYIQTLLKSYGVTKKIKILSIIEFSIQIVCMLISFKHGVYAIIYGQMLAIAISIVLHWYSFIKIEKE